MKSRQGPGGHLCSKVETLDPEKDLSAQSLETDNDHSWNGARNVELQGGERREGHPAVISSDAANLREEQGRCIPKVKGINLRVVPISLDIVLLHSCPAVCRSSLIVSVSPCLEGSFEKKNLS